MDQDIRNSDLLPLVRSKVRQGLTSSGAFRALPKDQQRDIANNTVKALHYIVGGADGNSRPSGVTVAGTTPLAGALAGRLSASPANCGGTVRGAGGAVAAEAGSEAFTDMINKVDFPGVRFGFDRRSFQRHRHIVHQANGSLWRTRRQRCEVRRPIHGRQRDGKQRT